MDPGQPCATSIHHPTKLILVQVYPVLLACVWPRVPGEAHPQGRVHGEGGGRDLGDPAGVRQGGGQADPAEEQEKKKQMESMSTKLDSLIAMFETRFAMVEANIWVTYSYVWRR